MDQAMTLDNVPPEALAEGLNQAIGTIMPLCNDQQKAFLGMMQQLPPAQFLSQLKSYAGQMSEADIEKAVNDTFPHVPVETRAAMFQQAIAAYNFLKTQ
jgi:hypothetical protein